MYVCMIKAWAVEADVERSQIEVQMTAPWQGPKKREKLYINHQRKVKNLNEINDGSGVLMMEYA